MTHIDLQVSMGLDVELSTEPDRNAWCTPIWLWSIPLQARRRASYDLDPCTNEHATVPARRRVSLPSDGSDPQAWGRLPYAAGLIWLNPPYSSYAEWMHIARWAAEVLGHQVWGVLPHAPSTKAWSRSGPRHAWTLGRVEFRPPPGVTPSDPMQEHDLVCWSSIDLAATLREEVACQIGGSGRPHSYEMRRTNWPPRSPERSHAARRAVT